MSLYVMNSTAYATYTPPVGSDGDVVEGEEDEDNQNRNCEKHVDDGTSTCAWIQRPTFDSIPIALSGPPDIHAGGIRRRRVARMITGVVGAPELPPPAGPVPETARLLRSRGTRHGIHRIVDVTMDVRATRFVRIWNVALDRAGRVLSATTFLFELRPRPRGGGFASFRLIEGKGRHGASKSRARAPNAKPTSDDAREAAEA